MSDGVTKRRKTILIIIIIFLLLYTNVTYVPTGNSSIVRTFPPELILQMTGTPRSLIT